MNDNGLAFAQLQYDRQEPPEYESGTRCSECDERINHLDVYYEIEDSVFCENCADDYFASCRRSAE